MIGQNEETLSVKIAGMMHKSGVILAKVTNIKDPDKLNRLKCKPISADKDVAETDWCFCLSPMAGKNYGQFFFPMVGDLVVIGYLGGDVHNPIIFGSYWANDTKAPYPIVDGKNLVRCIKTPKGIEIKLDDNEKKEKLTLTTPSGTMVFLDDEKKTIDIKDAKGENKLSIAWEKGEITLAAKTKLTLSAGETSLTLAASGEIEGKANKAVTLSAADVALKGKSSATIEGAKVDIKANGMLTAQASGNAVIKGALVQIN